MFIRFKIVNRANVSRKMKPAFIFLLVCLILSPFPLGAQTGGTGEWYQGKLVRNIIFDGLKHIKQSDLDSITETYIGERFTDALFWEMQGRLYELEYFDDISPHFLPAGERGNEVVIKLSVVERPVISKIEYRGNSGIRDADLRNTINLKLNDVFNQTKTRAAEQALIAKYIEKGYPAISIRYETQTNKDNTVTIVFVISEGERVTITQINFEGNEKFSSRTLRNQLSLTTKSLIKDGAFQEAKLLADRRTIEDYYKSRGYIDAAVTDVVSETTQGDKGTLLTLTFKIYEGRVYTFDGITFTGNNIFSTEMLAAQVRSKPGSLANIQRINADLERVRDLYYENGYIYNSISPQERRNMEQGTIGYTVSIVEHPRAYVEHIIVKGNKKTRDHVIIREIPLEPGDIFSKAKVLDGYRNLYNLQYFSNVVPDTPQGSVEGLLDLVLTVEEQPTTDIQAGLTFSGTSDPNAFPISAMIKWTDRNFMGYGNIFGIESNVSPDVQNISVNYTQRWILGPLSVGFDFTIQHARRYAAMDNHPPFFMGDEPDAFPDGFGSFEEYNSSNKTPADENLMSYEQYSISLGASTGYRWGTPYGNFSLGGGLRLGVKYNDYDRSLYRPFDRTLRERETWTPATSISGSASLDQRDIFYDPSNGYYISQRLGIYGLLPGKFEEEYFLRAETKAEWFATLWNIPVSDSWAFKGVFGIHTGFSMILPYFGHKLPVIEQANMLAIDGMFTGRGWQNQRSVRGYALWENWMEIRIPLATGILSADGFFDAAEVAQSPAYFFTTDNTDSFLNRMRFSFGGGLRFAIPQFPFRFLFAKRFIIKDGAFQWMPGAIGGDGKTGGVDFVLSFAISTY